MLTLPDYLADGLDIVFIGLNPSTYSVRLGHYFANPRNRFWAAINRAGIMPEELSPATDYRLLNHNMGFTDVVKRATAQGSGLGADDYRRWAPVLKEKLERYQPLVACFHGMVAYRNYLRYAEGRHGEAVALGLQQHTIGRSRVFVIPNPSPANAQYSLDALTDWYRKLHTFLRELKGT